MHPAQTGLPGIVEFHEAAEVALQGPADVVVAVVDVAHIMTANLAAGWLAGNAVIESQAQRLRGLLPEGSLWHLGGGTFTTLLTGKRSAELLQQVGELRELVADRLASPIVHDVLTFRGAAGVWAVVPAEGARPEQVFRDIQSIAARAWSVTNGNARSSFAEASTYQELAEIIASDGTEVFGLAGIRADILNHVTTRGDVGSGAPSGRLPTMTKGVRVEWWARNGGVADLGEFGSAIATAIDTRVELLSAVEHERQVGDRDALTGLLNRRGFLREVDRAAATDLILVFADLDHLKRINDTEGHAAGDRALCRMAGLLLEGRTSDVVGRWGGEEFVVALLGTDVEGASTWLRRLIDRGRAAAPPDLPVTFSAGVASRRDGETVEAVVARADAALYDAKHAGRATVVVA